MSSYQSGIQCKWQLDLQKHFLRRQECCCWGRGGAYGGQLLSSKNEDPSIPSGQKTLLCCDSHLTVSRSLSLHVAGSQNFGQVTATDSSSLNNIKWPVISQKQLLKVPSVTRNTVILDRNVWKVSVKSWDNTGTVATEEGHVKTSSRTVCRTHTWGNIFVFDLNSPTCKGRPNKIIKKAWQVWGDRFLADLRFNHQGKHHHIILTTVRAQLGNLSFDFCVWDTFQDWAVFKWCQRRKLSWPICMLNSNFNSKCEVWSIEWRSIFVSIVRNPATGVWCQLPLITLIQSLTQML
jgi:hypothetical protein